jgi:hypothetical protein
LAVQVIGSVELPHGGLGAPPPYQGSDDVLALADERDRRQQGNGAIRSALREPADRTWAPVRGHPLLRSGVTLRDLIEREGEGS